MKKTVAVGLSGGVDSAVSALLLKQKGFDVTGVFLYCFDQKGIPCTADEDRKMAIKVADSIGIPIKIIDLRSQYRRSVIDYFFSEYKAGRTPNPDVMCNKEIKFGLFYKKAIEEWDMDYVATGHYARVLSAPCHCEDVILGLSDEEIFQKIDCHDPPAGGSRNDSVGSNNKFFLAQGVDQTKDQSYFLYLLKAKQLEHILFPIGDYKKEQVRKIAKENKLPNWDRPDSQGICFVGEVNIRKFLSTKLKVQKGALVSRTGEIIGEHEGVWFYTIGQRHGFKIAESRELKIEDRNKKPLYILSKNSERNELVVGQKDECFRKEIMVENFHWINSSLSSRVSRSETWRSIKKKIASSDVLIKRPRNDNNGGMTVRIRHLGEMYKCQLQPYKSYNTYNSYKLLLEKPAFAVAPGQSAVVYFDNIVLGGGIICQ